MSSHDNDRQSYPPFARKREGEKGESIASPAVRETRGAFRNSSRRERLAAPLPPCPSSATPKGGGALRGSALALAIALAACAPAAESERTYDRDPALPADLPFSSAVVVGDTIYLAGEIGRAPGGTEVVEGGVGAETRQIFENYKRTLTRVGSSLDDIVKCTVFLDDMSKFAEMNAAYAQYFPNEKPVRSTFGVDGLALGAALEIECLAIRGGKS